MQDDWKEVGERINSHVLSKSAQYYLAYTFAELTLQKSRNGNCHIFQSDNAFITFFIVNGSGTASARSLSTLARTISASSEVKNPFLRNRPGRVAGKNSEYQPLELEKSSTSIWKINQNDGSDYSNSSTDDSFLYTS